MLYVLNSSVLKSKIKLSLHLKLSITNDNQVENGVLIADGWVSRKGTQSFIMNLSSTPPRNYTPYYIHTSLFKLQDDACLHRNRRICPTGDRISLGHFIVLR